MKFHALGGLPRSGSTLLCNILNTRPDVFASSSSPVGPALVTSAQGLVGRPEFTSELGNAPDATQRRGVAALRGFLRGWYEHRNEAHIIDKDRSNVWLLNRETTRNILVSGKLIVTVRDPVAVFGSVLSKHDTHPMTQPGGTLVDRMNVLFEPTGLIGAAMRSIENILLIQSVDPTKVDHVVFVAYEQLVANPALVLQQLEQILGLKPHEYDFDAIPKSATDRDELYGHIWPHEGSGRVEVRDPTWQKWVPPQLAQNIRQRYPLYGQTFGYLPKKA